MKTISFTAPTLPRVEASSASVLVLYRFEEMRPLRGITGLVDWRLYGHLSRVIIDGFFTGTLSEQLLVPLGRHLPQQFLLLIGLGERVYFGKERFTHGVNQAFETTRGLDARDLVVALPGRAEGICPIGDAIDWLINAYAAFDGDQEVTVIEPQGAQKVMVPAVERWRLKQLVPQ